jgi:hypothetical protein
MVVIGLQPGVAALAVVARGQRDARHRPRDRRAPDDGHARRRQMRVQEDLQRAAAQARVVFHHRPVERPRGLVVHAVVGIARNEAQ